MESDKRLPRFRRVGAERLALRLQDRDRKIFKLVYDYRFLTSRQIQLLIPGSDQVILRRLQKLFHHGYLDRLKTPAHEKGIYALGNRGADELTLHFGIDRGRVDWTAKNREVGERFPAHTLMIANFRVALTLALRDKPDTKILSWVPEGGIKDGVMIQGEGQRKMRVPINPDAFFTLEDRGDALYFLLEADRSTMTNERFLNKAKGYWSWWVQDKHKQHGIGDFRVLTITRTEARKENLRKISKEADDDKAGSAMFWFASEENFGVEDPKSILKPIWQAPGDDALHEILE